MNEIFYFLSSLNPYFNYLFIHWFITKQKKMKVSTFSEMASKSVSTTLYHTVISIKPTFIGRLQHYACSIRIRLGKKAKLRKKFSINNIPEFFPSHIMIMQIRMKRIEVKFRLYLCLKSLRKPICFWPLKLASCAKVLKCTKSTILQLCCQNISQVYTDWQNFVTAW